MKHQDGSRIKRAKYLRNNATDAEQQLWYFLRRSQVKGYKFRRQQPVGNYVVDFLCPAQKLVIELDGGQHADQHEYDRKRDAFLREEGYDVLRFWNHEWTENKDGVLERIYDALP